MKKIIIIVSVIVGLGAAYWLIAPVFITREIHQTLESATSGVKHDVIAEGAFTGVSGHSAEGTARLLKVGGKFILRFEDDFQVTNGPDLVVYLGSNGQYDSKTRLGRLKGTVGSQNYEIPQSIDTAKYNEAWIRCRTFFIGFGKAELR